MDPLWLSTSDIPQNQYLDTYSVLATFSSSLLTSYGIIDSLTSELHEEFRIQYKAFRASASTSSAPQLPVTVDNPAEVHSPTAAPDADVKVTFRILLAALRYPKAVSFRTLVKNIPEPLNFRYVAYDQPSVTKAFDLIRTLVHADRGFAAFLMAREVGIGVEPLIRFACVPFSHDPQSVWEKYSTEICALPECGRQTVVISLVQAMGPIAPFYLVDSALGYSDYAGTADELRKKLEYSPLKTLIAHGKVHCFITSPSTLDQAQQLTSGPVPYDSPPSTRAKATPAVERCGRDETPHRSGPGLFPTGVLDHHRCRAVCRMLGIPRSLWTQPSEPGPLEEAARGYVPPPYVSLVRRAVIALRRAIDEPYSHWVATLGPDGYHLMPRGWQDRCRLYFRPPAVHLEGIESNYAELIDEGVAIAHRTPQCWTRQIGYYGVPRTLFHVASLRTPLKYQGTANKAVIPHYSPLGKDVDHAIGPRGVFELWLCSHACTEISVAED